MGNDLNYSISLNGFYAKEKIPFLIYMYLYNRLKESFKNDSDIYANRILCSAGNACGT